MTLVKTEFEFKSAAEDYELCNALKLAEAAEFAYSKDEILRQIILSEWKLNDIEIVTVDNMRMFIAANDEMAFFIFVGTNDAKDWLVNISMKLIDFYYGKVHEGFKTALDSMKSAIASHYSKLLSKNQKIWISGHSLGGALATLFAAELVAENYKVQGLYTFGQPKVGNKEFCEKFDEQFKKCTFRFVNNNDGVSRVPTQWKLGYQHAGQLMYFGVTGRLYKNPPDWLVFAHTFMGWSANVCDSILQGFSVQSVESIADHNMKWYLANLKNLQIK